MFAPLPSGVHRRLASPRPGFNPSYSLNYYNESWGFGITYIENYHHLDKIKKLSGGLTSKFDKLSSRKVNEIFQNLLVSGSL